MQSKGQQPSNEVLKALNFNASVSRLVKTGWCHVFYIQEKPEWKNVILCIWIQLQVKVFSLFTHSHSLFCCVHSFMTKTLFCTRHEWRHVCVCVCVCVCEWERDSSQAKWQDAGYQEEISAWMKWAPTFTHTRTYTHSEGNQRTKRWKCV